MSTAFPVLSRSDHKLLRSESCSGYTDVFGNWNTGFYCPQSESKAAVYCCGTETYKYCCTAKDPNDEGITEVPQSNPYSIRTPMIVGAVSGLIFIAFFITLATCFFCPCCLFHKKRTSNIPAGLYRLQCGTSSTTSPLVNTNSHSSNLNSFTRLPLDYGNNNMNPPYSYGHPGQNFSYGIPNANTNNVNGLLHIGCGTVSNYSAGSTAPPIPVQNNNNGFHLSSIANGFHQQNQHQNLYDHFNPVLRTVSGINQNQNQNQPPQNRSNCNDLAPAPYYFQPPAVPVVTALSAATPAAVIYKNDPKIYTDNTFQPRCRESYTNELTGSPCFTSTHLEQPTNSEILYPSPSPSAMKLYNYSNTNTNTNSSKAITIASAPSPSARNSFPNAFSTSTPLVYNNFRRSGGVFRLKPLHPDMVISDDAELLAEKLYTRTLDRFSKSVHFADRKRSYENGCASGNSIADILTTRTNTGMEMANSGILCKTKTSLSAPSTPTQTQTVQNQEKSTGISQVNFKGLSNNLRESDWDNERSSLCEILTVL